MEAKKGTELSTGRQREAQKEADERTKRKESPDRERGRERREKCS